MGHFECLANILSFIADPHTKVAIDATLLCSDYFDFAAIDWALISEEGLGWFATSLQTAEPYRLVG